MTSTTYVIEGGRVGRERLRVLSDVLAESTGELFGRLPILRNARCLDAGCGAGDVTRALASRVPTGSVVGIDVDPVKLAAARDDAERLGLTNVAYSHGDVTEPLDEFGRFDVVYARFVLCHLAHPHIALRHLIDVVAPGGLLMVEDVDISGAFCYPPSAAFQRCGELFERAMRSTGGDPNIGRRLPLLLRAAGLDGVGMHITQPAGWNGDVKRIQAITLAATRHAILAAGLASPEEVDAVVDQLHALAERDDTIVTVARIVQSWGWKA
jgi:SAM-dependent methyltransferase